MTMGGGGRHRTAKSVIPGLTRDLAMVPWCRHSRLRENDVAWLGESVLAVVWPGLLALDNSVILPGQALKNNALSANTIGGEHE
jgi:hypothetical protein